MKKLTKMVDGKTHNRVGKLDVQKSKTLHKSIKSVLVLVQCMGQMPVIGITEFDSRHLQFKWKSWRTVYCLLNCVGAGFITSVYVYQTARYGIDLYRSATIAFHISTFMVTLFFLRLAIVWPRLMHKWSHMESSMRSYEASDHSHLHSRITVMTVIILTIAAIEYMMVRGNEVYLSILCQGKNDDLFEIYCTAKFSIQIFQTIEYAFWKCFLMQISNFLMTFAWSWNDLFLMLIGTALALRFRQVAEKVKLLKKDGNNGNVVIWRKVREDYNRLSELTRSLDEALSYITLTSFASNLFLILSQLFNSLRKMEDTLEKVYFFFSFGFLIMRTICVTIYGAWIHDESKQPMAILNSVSSEVYNIEIRRFTEQIKFDTVALTGKNFFYITRGLILSMAGAIVTYELVLIQFNESLLKESAENVKNFTSSCKTHL